MHTSSFPVSTRDETISSTLIEGPGAQAVAWPVNVTRLFRSDTSKLGRDSRETSSINILRQEQSLPHDCMISLFPVSPPDLMLAVDRKHSVDTRWVRERTADENARKTGMIRAAIRENFPRCTCKGRIEYGKVPRCRTECGASRPLSRTTRYRSCHCARI